MKKYFYIILSAISIAFWYACTPPLEGITLKLPVALKGSNVIIQFNPDNGSAGELPKTLSVKIAGKDSLQIVDIIGGRDFEIKDNVLSVAAKPGVTPSTTNPIKFTVVVEADGYLKSVTPVSITSVKDLNLSVELTKISAPATGITVVQQPATVASTGTTSAAISVVTPANNSITEKATISIPSGVTMKDGAGVPVGGELNIVVTKADASKTDVSVNTSEIANIVDKNNQPISNFSIVPIIGVEVEITNDDNQKVKSFTGEINIKTEIPAGSIDPLTKKELKAGDLMAITSFDEDTKAYKYEGSATLAVNAAGKLEVSGKVNHLTRFYFASFGSIRYATTNLTTEILVKVYLEAKRIFGPNFDAGQVVVFKNYTILFGGKVNQYADETFHIDLTFKDNSNRLFSITDRKIDVTTNQIISRIVIKNLLSEVILSIDNPVFDANSAITLELPDAPNFVNFVADITCKNGKRTNADNIQVYAKIPNYSSVGYFYLGKANNNGTKVTGTTTLLKRNSNYDFKFMVGKTPLKYLNKKVSSGSDFTISGTLENTFCD